MSRSGTSSAARPVQSLRRTSRVGAGPRWAMAESSSFCSTKGATGADESTADTPRTRSDATIGSILLGSCGTGSGQWAHHRWVASHIGISMVPAEAVGGSQTRRQRARRWRSSRLKAGQGHAGRLRGSTHLVESAVRGAAAAASGSGRADEAPAPAPARAAARRLRRGRGRESATRMRFELAAARGHFSTFRAPVLAE